MTHRTDILEAHQRESRLRAAAPKLLAACKLWLEAVQNDLGLRLALVNLPEDAGAALVDILQEAIAAAEEGQ